MFDWDEANADHVALHGVSVEEAEEAILDRHRVSHPAHQTTEPRWAILGATVAGRVLLVVFTRRRSLIRVVAGATPPRVSGAATGGSHHLMTDTKENITDEGFAIIDRMADVPQFASEAEEAEFWSTHTFSEALLDEFQPVPEEGDDVLPPARKSTSAVSVRLEHDVLFRLRRLAARKHFGYQTLLKRFVTERLYEEEKREGLLGMAPK